MQFFKNVFSKIRKVSTVYLFVFKEIKKSSKLLLFILLLSTLVDGTVPIIIKYIIKIMVFHLENNKGFNIFLLIVGIYVFVIFLKNCLLKLKDYINSISIHKFIYCIQNKIIDKVQKIEYKTFYSPYFQDYYNTVLQNSQVESSNLLFITIQMATLIIQFITICIFIIKFSPIILISLTICFIPTVLLNLKNEKDRVKVIDDCALPYRKNLYYFSLFTSVSSIKEIKIFNLKNLILRNKEYTFYEYLQKWKTFGKKELTKKIFSEILPCLCTFSSILVIVYNVINRKYSIANFIFLVSMIASFKEVIDTLVSIISKNYRCIAFANKLFNLLDSDSEIKYGNRKLIVNNNHMIEFRNVYFKYPYSKKYALKNISFKISIGEKIALVGQNGCGKTTIINLILRLYEPMKGEILLDGINIKDYDYAEYLKLFSVVFQDYQPYSFKLTDYISSGDIESSENLLKIKKSAVMTTADHFIEKSPLNWESNLTTRFDKNGLELSGGQWQKLAVARAFYSDAPILILDEPTSAMDAISESHIYESIKNIGENKTAIFISHRMYSSKIATKIIYIENGEIKNIGTHDELMKKSGGYKELFEEQANRY